MIKNDQELVELIKDFRYLQFKSQNSQNKDLKEIALKLNRPKKRLRPEEFLKFDNLKNIKYSEKSKETEENEDPSKMDILKKL